MIESAGPRDGLRRARLSEGLTQEQLAERADVTPRTVQRAEAGGPLLPHTVAQLARALGRTPAELGLVDCEARGRLPGDGAATGRLPAWGGDDVSRRQVLGLVAVGGGWVAPVPWAAGADASGDGPPTDGEVLRAFRAADPQLGGGHLYTAVVRYLEDRVAPRLFGRVPGDRGPDVFCVAAALTDMAGWMAHDAGRDALADQHFARASGLAQAGGDAELEANILASRSHLALQTGRPATALALARAGRTALRRGRRNPCLDARLAAMEARSRAERGEATPCVRLLGDAAGALAAAGTSPTSEWASRFDEGSLAAEAALALRRLGRLADGRRHAERVLVLRPGERTRSRAFGHLTLAGIHAEQGDLDQACAVGHEVLRATVALGSARVVHQLHDLRALLRPHRSTPAVGHFLAHAADELRGRTVLAAAFGDGPPPAA